MPPHLLHMRCRQCFPTFCGTFHVRTWPQLLSGHNPLKGRLKGARPAQNSSPQTASLFVRRHRGGPQILRLEIASWTSTSESEPYVCLAALFRVTSPGKRNAPRRSRFGEHRLRSSRHTNSPWSQTYPLNPEAPWILKPTPIACFYEFLCRAVSSCLSQFFTEKFPARIAQERRSPTPSTPS